MKSLSSTTPRNKKIIPLFLITAALIGSLSACAPESSVKPQVSNLPSKASTPVKTAQSTSSAGASSAPLEGIALDLTCEKILSTKALYDLNPNFAYVPDQKPESGSLPEQFSELKGINCQYVNMSGGETIWLSVAKLAGTGNDTVLAGLQTTSTPTSVFGEVPTVYGFCTAANGVGQAQVITGNYWISAESTWFLSADDANNFIRAAIDSVP
jgi:hypothetical protein